MDPAVAAMIDAPPLEVGRAMHALRARAKAGDAVAVVQWDGLKLSHMLSHRAAVALALARGPSDSSDASLIARMCRDASLIVRTRAARHAASLARADPAAAVALLLDVGSRQRVALARAMARHGDFAAVETALHALIAGRSDPAAAAALLPFVAERTAEAALLAGWPLTDGALHAGVALTTWQALARRFPAAVVRVFVTVSVPRSPQSQSTADVDDDQRTTPCNARASTDMADDQRIATCPPPAAMALAAQRSQELMLSALLAAPASRLFVGGLSVAADDRSPVTHVIRTAAAAAIDALWDSGTHRIRKQLCEALSARAALVDPLTALPVERFMRSWRPREAADAARGPNGGALVREGHLQLRSDWLRRVSIASRAELWESHVRHASNEARGARYHSVLEYADRSVLELLDTRTRDDIVATAAADSNLLDATRASYASLTCDASLASAASAAALNSSDTSTRCLAVGHRLVGLLAFSKDYVGIAAAFDAAMRRSKEPDTGRRAMLAFFVEQLRSNASLRVDATSLTQFAILAAAFRASSDTSEYTRSLSGEVLGACALRSLSCGTPPREVALWVRREMALWRRSVIQNVSDGDEPPLLRVHFDGNVDHGLVELASAYWDTFASGVIETPPPAHSKHVLDAAADAAAAVMADGVSARPHIKLCLDALRCCIRTASPEAVQYISAASVFASRVADAAVDVATASADATSSLVAAVACVSKIGVPTASKAYNALLRCNGKLATAILPLLICTDDGAQADSSPPFREAALRLQDPAMRNIAQHAVAAMPSVFTTPLVEACIVAAATSADAPHGRDRHPLPFMGSRQYLGALRALAPNAQRSLSDAIARLLRAAADRHDAAAVASYLRTIVAMPFAGEEAVCCVLDLARGPSREHADDPRSGQSVEASAGASDVADADITSCALSACVKLDNDSCGVPIVLAALQDVRTVRAAVAALPSCLAVVSVATVAAALCGMLSSGRAGASAQKQMLLLLGSLGNVGDSSVVAAAERGAALHPDVRLALIPLVWRIATTSHSERVTIRAWNALHEAAMGAAAAISQGHDLAHAAAAKARGRQVCTALLALPRSRTQLSGMHDPMVTFSERVLVPLLTSSNEFAVESSMRRICDDALWSPRDSNAVLAWLRDCAVDGGTVNFRRSRSSHAARALTNSCTAPDASSSDVLLIRNVVDCLIQRVHDESLAYPDVAVALETLRCVFEAAAARGHSNEAWGAVCAIYDVCRTRPLVAHLLVTSIVQTSPTPAAAAEKLTGIPMLCWHHETLTAGIAAIGAVCESSLTLAQSADAWEEALMGSMVVGDETEATGDEYRLLQRVHVSCCLRRLALAALCAVAAAPLARGGGWTAPRKVALARFADQARVAAVHDTTGLSSAIRWVALDVAALEIEAQ